jgi:hypothetical protein
VQVIIGGDVVNVRAQIDELLQLKSTATLDIQESEDEKLIWNKPN